MKGTKNKASPSPKSATHKISNEIYGNECQPSARFCCPIHTPTYHTPAYRHNILERTVTHNFKTGQKIRIHGHSGARSNNTLAKTALSSRDTQEMWRHCNRTIIYTSHTANPRIRELKTAFNILFFLDPHPPPPEYLFNENYISTSFQFTPDAMTSNGDKFSNENCLCEILGDSYRRCRGCESSGT